MHEVASALRGSDIPLGIIRLVPETIMQLPKGFQENIDEAIDVLINGVDRCAAWRFPRQALRYPSPVAMNGMGQPKMKAVVRWVFLESDAELLAQYLVLSYLEQRIKGNKKYTYLGITTIPFWKEERYGSN